MAASEASKGSVMVVLVWIGKSQGKLIRGMHTTTVTLLPERSGLPDTRVSAKPDTQISGLKDTQISGYKRVAVNYLSIGLNHCNKIKFNFPKLLIPIIVHIKSNNPTNNIIFSIDIINGDNHFNNNNEPDLYENGLTWGNKISHLEIELLPYETKKIQFLAVISKSGMFDLNR